MELSNKTIMLVDAETIKAHDIKKQLEEHTYNVVLARNGEEAISTIADTKIDMILMDSDLGNDIDETEAVSKILENHDVPVVFLLNQPEQDIFRKIEKIESYGITSKQSSMTIIDALIKKTFEFDRENIIFSPGCASFDLFENAKERGKLFSKIIKNM